MFYVTQGSTTATGCGRTHLTEIYVTVNWKSRSPSCISLYKSCFKCH